MDIWHFSDIIILAIIAGFLLYRLRLVLGRKDYGGNIDTSGNSAGVNSGLKTAREKTDSAVNNQHKADEESKETQDSYKIKDKAVSEIVQKIKEIDKGFSPTPFLQGAEIAFEMIFSAYNKADKDTLKPLVSKELYQDFSDSIEENNKNVDRKHETTLVSINSADLVGAKLDKKTAYITVNFISEQIDLVKDKDGKVVEGNPAQINIITDNWVFSRNLNSSNPNWVLVSTDGSV